MKNYNVIWTERRYKKISIVSSEIDKYECLRGEEILPLDQSKFFQSSSWKVSENQKKNKLKTKKKTNISNWRSWKTNG